MKEETFQHESVILFSRRWNVGSNDGVTLHKTFREVASSSTSSCYVRRVGATGRTRTPDGWGASGGGGYVFLHNTAAAHLRLRPRSFHHSPPRKETQPKRPGRPPAPTSNAQHGVYNSPGGNAAVVEHVQNVNPIALVSRPLARIDEGAKSIL